MEFSIFVRIRHNLRQNSSQKRLVSEALQHEVFQPGPSFGIVIEKALELSGARRGD
jgi:hypothetical protein